ncbi:hypothetical protein Hanom_Chr12g01076981 [Helianthus anomalus]
MRIFTTLPLSVTFVINIPQGDIRTYGGSWVWDLFSITFLASRARSSSTSTGCNSRSVFLRRLLWLVKPCDVYDLRTLRFVSLGSSSGLGLLQCFLLRNNFARRLFHRLLNVLLSRPKRLDNKLGFLRFWLFVLL